MPDFNYWATTESGDAVTGRLTASSPDAAAHLLTQRGLVVQRLEEAAEPAPAIAEPVTLTESDFAPLATNPEATALTRLPLITSLRAVAEESRSLRFRHAIRTMVAQLEQGRPLTDVLKNLPRAFPRRMTGLVDAGVRSGQLPHLMQHALDHLRRAAELRRRIRWNLSYPALLMLIAAAIVGGILVGLVPTFKHIFDDFGTDLPGVTKVIIGVSDLFVNMVWGIVDLWRFFGWTWWVLLLLIGVAVMIGLGFLIGEIPIGLGVRRFWQRLIGWLPLVGPVYRAASLSGFFRLLAMLVETGFSLPDALRLAAQINHDAVLAAGVEQITADLEQGTAPIDAVRVSESFPRDVLPIFRWAGNRPLFVEALRGAADIYASRSQLQSSVAVVVLEPTLIFGVGMTVGLVVIALFMPLIKLLNDLA